MGYMIEITENKLDEMAESVDTMLRAGGKLMSCIDGLQRSHGRMGERSPMMDYRNGGRMGWRDESYESDYEDYGERRGVAGSGRRYR